ncbi:MAG TPA: hypothetical protein PK794_05225, partial [Armatimonadota bacterium]|nr:hypothetical protein [Armatimonadota bacterium]
EGRPDWHDAISIIARQGRDFDWMYLLYLAQQHPRRVLAFFLFAQTEMHAPAGSPSSQVENQLFPGDADGPIPEWAVLTLLRQIWGRAARSPLNPYRLDRRNAA